MDTKLALLGQKDSQLRVIHMPPDGEKLTHVLPHYIKEESIGFSTRAGSDTDVITDILQKYCSSDKFSEVKKSLKNVVIFEKHKVKSGKNTVPRLKKTHLSLNEKRKLGLYKLSRNGLNYEKFLELKNLWMQYMLDSLDLNTFKNKKGKIDVGDKQWEQLSSQLYKADYHGAELTVTRAKCPSLVGTCGIVVMDTKNTFRLIGKDNIIRTIPKESCVFQIHLKTFKLTLYGGHLCVKPAERSTKKIRSNLSLDL